jgi:hypothetical protein
LLSGCSRPSGFQFPPTVHSTAEGRPAKCQNVRVRVMQPCASALGWKGFSRCWGLGPVERNEPQRDGGKADRVSRQLTQLTKPGLVTRPVPPCHWPIPTSTFPVCVSIGRPSTSSTRENCRVVMGTPAAGSVPNGNHHNDAVPDLQRAAGVLCHMETTLSIFNQERNEKRKETA